MTAHLLSHSLTILAMFRNIIPPKSILHHPVCTNGSVLFTIGYVQDPIVQFASPSGIKDYLPLWKSYFTTAMEMIYFHYQDFAHARKVSNKLDSKIEKDADRVSKNGNYAAIVALSARQALGGVVFAESAPGQIRDGKESKPLVFLKEISSDGNMQTVDVIFPAYRPFLG
jgi:Domain of unknown function (DUF5127)/Domain of unknown function (DUF4965)